MLLNLLKLLTLSLALLACGPVTAITTIAEATVALKGAEGAQAKQYAKYEYVRAREHLRKAKEEEGFSDFQAAINLALESRNFSEKAKKRAMNNPARGLTPSSSKPNDLKSSILSPVGPIPASGSSL